MSDRKVMLIPLTHGVVSFATSEFLSVSGDGERLDLKRDQIVGRHPEKGEQVLVLDIQELADAIRAGDDDLVEVFVGGTVRKHTAKSTVIDLDGGKEVVLPKQFVELEAGEYVRDVRMPRWLAMDRGLSVERNR